MSDIRLEHFQKNLEKASKELDGKHQVSFDNIFTNSFMRKYTSVSNFDEFLTAGGFEVNSEEDFEAIPDDDMDNYVRKSTEFSSWQEMLNTAGEEYALKKLGF
jgi:hypothetical protein